MPRDVSGNYHLPHDFVADSIANPQVPFSAQRLMDNFNDVATVISDTQPTETILSELSSAASTAAAAAAAAQTTANTALTTATAAQTTANAAIPSTQKGAANGVATLDSNTLIPAAQIPTRTETINAQTGTTYTVVNGDQAKLITFSNASSISVTLPQAGTSSQFLSGWYASVVNIGAGTVTITPTTSTINGASSLVLLTGQGCRIVSNGTNYLISMAPVNVVVSAGKVATLTNSLTFSGTDSTTMTFPAASSTVLTTGNNATITKGFYITPYNAGTFSSGTFTPDAANGNYQYYTNNGAHTLSAPSTDSALDIMVTNSSGAGAITFSGFTVSSFTGDALTTTSTNKFVLSIRRINAVATYMVKALQ